MANFKAFIVTATVALLGMQPAWAGDSAQEQRHDLMEDAGGAAKTIGKMLEGENPFDADAAMTALKTWSKVAGEVGSLFPEGSESGYDTRAKPSIWSDREGFDKALEEWAGAIDAAIVANPQDLDSLQAAAGPVFKKCKACHEQYRAEKE